MEEIQAKKHDEKYKEYARHFSTCAKVFNVLENKQPVESRCPFGAIGEVNQKPLPAISQNYCYQCPHYCYRECGIEAIEKNSVSKYIEKARVAEIHHKKQGRNLRQGYLYHELLNDDKDSEIFARNVKEAKKQSKKEIAVEDYINII